MRLHCLVLAAALLGGAPSTPAAILDATAALSISLRAGGPGGPVASVGGTGTGVVELNGSGALTHLTGLAVSSGFVGVSGVATTITGASVVRGLLGSFGHQAGAFGGAGFGGAMPLLGFAKICLFATCNSGVVPVNLSVPLSVVGIGGSGNVSFSVNVTVLGDPWTTGSVPFGTTSVAGFVHGPASLTSSTAAAGGVVRLVTPIFISTNIPAVAVVPGYASLQLAFVPEPTTLLLLGAGMASLVALGRRRLADRRGPPPPP